MRTVKIKPKSRIPAKLVLVAQHKPVGVVTRAGCGRRRAAGGGGRGADESGGRRGEERERERDRREGGREGEMR